MIHIELSKRKYKTLDVLWLMLRMSPICVSLRVFLTIVEVMSSTAILALATAHFVDTTTIILEGGRSRADIYLPLLLLILVLGVFTTIGAVIQLVGARIRLSLQSKIKPAVVCVHAEVNFKHIESAESWELISRVSRDPVGSLMRGFDAFMLMTQVVFSIAAVLGLIVVQVWWAALIIVAFATPMFWLSVRAGKRNYQAGRDAEKFNRRTEYLDGVLTGRDNVDERTLFGYGGEIGVRWQEQYEAGRILQLKVTLRRFLIAKGSSLILALISLLIALTLIGPVMSGDISAGMFMGIVGAVFSMINMLGWEMSNALENISKVSEYMKDLTAFLELSKTADALVEPEAKPLAFHTLEFRDIRFRYPTGDNYVLNGLSFSLDSRRHYAFVGKNGAGKTTITKLLTGLYTEYEGEIFINGRELRTYPAATLKALFSVVYQDFARYYIPLRDNIALGDVAGSAAIDVEPIAALAGLDELISELKDGLDTPLGKIKDGGQDISGGQWQRVAIARSLISRAPVKILDEPTAALDPISESRIYEEFGKLMQGKTTVFISHRLGSTKLADEILVIDNGKVIERGTHEELMTANGQYAEMFEAQRSWYQ